jgi:hypothetical protein
MHQSKNFNKFTIREDPAELLDSGFDFNKYGRGSSSEGNNSISHTNSPIGPEKPSPGVLGKKTHTHSYSDLSRMSNNYRQRLSSGKLMDKGQKARRIENLDKKASIENLVLASENLDQKASIETLAQYVKKESQQSLTNKYGDVRDSQQSLANKYGDPRESQQSSANKYGDEKIDPQRKLSRQGSRLGLPKGTVGTISEGEGKRHRISM